MRPRRIAVLVVLLSLIARPVFADVVWPALVLEARLLAWWAIGIGLLIEFIIVRWLFNLDVKRAGLATIAANAASTILGLPLIPISGIAWELFPASLYMRALRWGTFNPITWAATYMLATTINTYIESVVYRKAFNLKMQRREYAWIFIANALSVGLAFASLFIAPPQM